MTCGIVRYRRRTFVAATAAAAVIWAASAFFLGRLGGKAFENRPWAGFLVALGAALALSILIEAARRINSRRRSREASSPEGIRPGTPTARSAGHPSRPGGGSAEPGRTPPAAGWEPAARWFPISQPIDCALGQGVEDAERHASPGGKSHDTSRTVQQVAATSTGAHALSSLLVSPPPGGATERMASPSHRESASPVAAAEPVPARDSGHRQGKEHM